MLIPAHFHGPPTSGNGGYTCGLLDAQTTFISEVTLRKPIPLDVEMQLHWKDEQLALTKGDELVATVKEGQLADLVLPTPPDYTIAVAAAKNYIGLTEKLAFTTCFVCGTDREADKGLHIYTGPVPGDDTYAAPWIPAAAYGDENGLVKPHFIWAALDCPGAYAAMGDEKLTIVLGRMTAQLHQPLKTGERCVIHAWSMGHEGRKHFSGTAIYNENGLLIGKAKAIWFEV